MRILIVHNQLWAHYKAIIFNELQKIITPQKGHELFVVQIATIEKSRLNLGDLDTTIHQYPYKLLHQGTLEDVSLWQRAWGVISQISTFKPNVVNLTGYYDLASWIILFYCKLVGIKTVLSNESTSGDHQRVAVKEFIKSLIVKQFDGFFNFGTSSENYLIELGGNPEKMLVNLNCVDNEMLKSIYQEHYQRRKSRQKEMNLPSKNFIFVGRLIDKKNLYAFLESFKMAQQVSKEDWGVIIVGDGEEKDNLKKFVLENDIPKVSFQIGVSWQQVPEFLALSDVLVLPSYSETWGLVVNEAMACGLPVLVSEKCGCAIDLVIDGKNGFLLSPYNTQQMSNVLLSCMEKKIDLKQMGEASEKIIKKYSPENVAKEMFEGYLAIL